MKPRELEPTIRALLQQTLGDRDLREQLEALAAREISFSGFTWLYGPELYRRNRILFRPFLLSHFSHWMLLPKWRSERILWKGSRAAALDAWLAEVDQQDDVELFRRLYEWKLGDRFDGRRAEVRNTALREALETRLAAATTPAQRQLVLRKFDLWFALDEDSACRLLERDPRAAAPFILRRLPSTWLGNDKRRLWTRLTALAQARGDEAFRWRLYRRQVPLAQWTADGLALCRQIRDPFELCRELERRHPEGSGLNLADGFLQFLQQRGTEVFPYLMRHLRQVWRGWLGRGHYGKLADFARDRGWWDLWSALVRTCSAPKEYNQQVRALVEDHGLAESQVRERLLALAGASREWNWPGLGLTTVHGLEEATALALYGRFPDLLRGPYRLHVQANLWGPSYPKLIEQLLAAQDEDLLDHLASRLVTRSGRWGNAPKLLQEADRLADYYEALKANEAAFSRRAARVLSQVPAFSIWRYGPLIRENRLARLLFERSAATYLADPASLADLVEASEIHVMGLAYRALGLDDDRARTQAATHLPLLLGTLLRPMQRDTRTLAFGALANAAVSPETARRILDRARDALHLPDTRYPKERLLGLIARLLHRWPELRSPGEQPRVYTREAA